MTTWIVEIRRSLSKADSVVSIISRYRKKAECQHITNRFLEMFDSWWHHFSKKVSECSAVGSALRSGRRGRAFESPHSDRRRQTSKIGCRFFFFTFTNRCKWDQRKNLRDFISMHIIFVQFLIERVSDLTIAYLFYIISTFTKDIRKQSPIT